ncbi:hypothetical protein BY996DRAFT_6464971 [Phakopsora pachyrhizi]|nr:hypothetical protein BY996DRAFT_6464971 [Phakopsora pachyrhizi]
MPEVGSTRVATGRNRLSGRRRGSWKGNVDIAGPTTADGILQGQRLKGGSGGLYGDMGWISQNQRRKGVTIAGPTKARIRFGGIRIVQRIRKPWEGKRPAGGRTGKGREVSVGLVRRRETPHQRRTDIWGISKAVVGRAVLLDFDIGRSK